MALQVAAAAGQSTAVATIATVTAAVQSTWGGDKRLTKDKLHNPTEWFVADDPMSRTRYFIIQGSDTLDHWKVNLTFDPVVFEDPSLGVKVTSQRLQPCESAQSCMTWDVSARLTTMCTGPYHAVSA